jgi:hypothetical protein
MYHCYLNHAEFLQHNCDARPVIFAARLRKPILTYSQQIYLTATTDPCHAVKRPRSDNNQADASSNRTNKPQNSHSGELIRGGKGPSCWQADAKSGKTEKPLTNTLYACFQPIEWSFLQKLGIEDLRRRSEPSLVVRL